LAGLSTTLLTLFTTSALFGCSAQVHSQPPGVPPSPKTITVENPGGDSADPEEAALERLSREPWGARRDRTGSLVIPLPDARHWMRVRIWGYPTRTAFRFGDDHFGIMAVWFRPTTEDDSPEACLDRFVAEARPSAESYGVRVVETHLVRTEHRGTRGVHRPMVVQVIDAKVPGFFSGHEYAGAVAAAPSWPGTCLVEGFVVPSDKHGELARKVRDRWVAEGAPRLVWNGRLTEAPALDDK
jgi:hypothetical protein